MLLLRGDMLLAAHCADREGIRFGGATCSEYAKAGGCLRGHAANLCPLSCGLCSLPPPPLPFPPPSPPCPPQPPPAPPALPASVCVEQAHLIPPFNAYTAIHRMPPRGDPYHHCFFGALVPAKNFQTRYKCESHGINWAPRANTSQAPSWPPTPAVEAFHARHGSGMDSFVQIVFWSGDVRSRSSRSAVRSCTSSVVTNQANPQYSMCCAVAEPWTAFTVRLWKPQDGPWTALWNRWFSWGGDVEDGWRVHERHVLAARTFYTPGCSGAFWFPMQKGFVRYNVYNRGKRTYYRHAYYGEVGIRVDTWEGDHVLNQSEACELVPYFDPPAPALPPPGAPATPPSPPSPPSPPAPPAPPSPAIPPSAPPPAPPQWPAPPAPPPCPPVPPRAPPHPRMPRVYEPVGGAHVFFRLLGLLALLVGGLNACIAHRTRRRALTTIM
jgi:hypothetical protein